MVSNISKEEMVYALVAQIPPGYVSTYGQIAKILNLKSARMVGRILHQNLKPKQIPCHRVVNYLGRVAPNFAFGGGSAQSAKLESEGVIFISDRVNLRRHLWKSNK